jgi:hypothetical protein
MSLTFAGTADAGATVTLSRGSVVVGTTTANPQAGTWSITDAVAAHGVSVYTATATNAAGNTSPASEPVSVTVDTVAPLLNISGAADGSTYTLPDLPVAPTFNPTDAGGSGVVDKSDNWTTPGTSNGAGRYSYTATATDRAGNSQSDARTYTAVEPASAGGGGGGGAGSGGGGGYVSGDRDAIPPTPITPAVVTTPPVATTPLVVKPAPSAKVKPVIGKPTTMPKKLFAGQSVVISFKVTRSDTGRRLISGKMTCDPTLGGQAIKHRGQFTRGTATVRFTIPKAAKGKLLKVRLTITLGAQRATRTSSFHIT